MVFHHNIYTEKRNETINITKLVEESILKSGIKDGIAIIYTTHTTAGITINENADPDVQKDMICFLNKLIPNLPTFEHTEGNSDSHIKSTLVGNSKTLIIENGKLILGRWQGLYFFEFDGPRERKVIIKVIGD
mgnify:CR=1 FL=1